MKTEHCIELTKNRRFSKETNNIHNPMSIKPVLEKRRHSTQQQR